MTTDLCGEDAVPPAGSAPRRRPVLPAVLGGAAGGYLVPAVSTAVNALLIPDPEVAHRLAHAAWTTLGIPSAAAAALATAWYHGRTPPARPAPAATIVAFLRAALTCAVLSAAGTAVLVAHGVLDPTAFSFTISAAAVGGGITARRWARTHRRRSRRRPPPTAAAEEGNRS